MATPPTGRPRGRPKFEPTPEQITAVQVLTACGFTQPEICTQILNPPGDDGTPGAPITEKTLRKAFGPALERGKDGANALVARSLFKKATGNGPQSVTAAIFWLKTQAGWREPAQAMELSGPGGAPIMTANAVDLSRLDDAELIALEAVMLKLQAPAADAPPGALPVYAPDEAP